jgi:hypothetical protein
MKQVTKLLSIDLTIFEIIVKILNWGIEITKGGDIETKILYLVKGHPTHFQLQYDGICGMGLSVAKINYYGNQSSL